MDASRPAERAPRQRSSEHWAVLGLALASLVGLLVLGLWVEPDPRGFGTHEKLGFQPCLPMDRWNVPCPGCGVTTSVTLAVHGRLWDSFANQPFGFALTFALGLFAVWAPLAHLRGRDLAQAVRRWSAARLLTVAGVALALGWVYKLLLVRGWLG